MHMNELDSLVESAQQLFAQSATPADLENAKAQFLGKSGRVTELMKGMAQLSVEEKKSRGAAINVAKQAIEAALTARRQALQDAELQEQLKQQQQQLAAAQAADYPTPEAKQTVVMGLQGQIAQTNGALAEVSGNLVRELAKDSSSGGLVNTTA